MTRRVRISAVMVTYNEAAVLEECLKSLQPWVDEIVATDMYSTDGTREILARYTDMIYDHAHDPIAEYVRQEGIARATGDWILVIDPDERIPPTLAQRLRTIAEEDAVDIVWIHRRMWAFGTPLQAASREPREGAVSRYFRAGAAYWPAISHSLPVGEGLRELYLPREESLLMEHETWRNANEILVRLGRYAPAEVHSFHGRGHHYTTGSMVREAIDTFMWSFVGTRAYKDRTKGFWLSMMLTIYRIYANLYLWEAEGYPDMPAATSRRLARVLQGLYLVWRAILKVDGAVSAIRTRLTRSDRSKAQG